MTTYVVCNGELVEKSAAVPLDATHIISDTMQPLKHMANGRIYDSKSGFRNATKAAGCIEVGNDSSFGRKPRVQIKLDKRERVESIRKAIYELQNGRRA